MSCHSYSNYSDDDVYSHKQFFIKDVDTKSANGIKVKYPPLSLLQDSNDLSILKYLPRNFELKTNNTCGKFNLDLLIFTCPKIKEFVEKNPNAFSYYLDVDDSMSVLKKFELMYQCEKVFFESKDMQISKEIAHLLGLENSFLEPGGIIMSFDCCSNFLRSERFQNFTISTKKNKYTCNSYAVYFSDVIKDLIIKDPTIRHFEYDIDDEFGQFQTVCSLLNFETIVPTKNNIYFLKEIAEDLKITKILAKADEIISIFENDSKVIDEQQKMVDSIEELFRWLYNIDNLKIETVKDLIVDSFWSKKEDDVRELAAFIIHVIKTNYLVHSSIADLLILLQKEANETNSLNILIPLIVSYLLPIMKSKINYCSFIYKLHKKGIISKEDLLEKVEFQCKSISDLKSLNEYNLLVWFLPELIENERIDEIYDYDYEDDDDKEDKIYDYDDDDDKEEIYDDSILQLKSFISYYLDKIDQYKIMRDKGKPDDELTNSLINDDVDKLQSIITNTTLDFTKKTVPVNMYFENKKGKLNKFSYINYAAMFGSIKCFKYLLLNHAEIDENTFPCAIKGGNIEIIKIADEKSKKFDYFKAVNLTIKNHQNDLFDWILENKYADKLDFDFKSKLLIKSVKCGNAHSFTEIMDNGFEIKDFLQSFIRQSAKCGFYRLFKLIITLSSKEAVDQLIISEKNKEFPFISFGNLSIFKLSLELTNIKRYIEKTFSIAIKNNYKNIIDYFLSNLINKVFKISEHGAYKALKYSIQNQSTEFNNSLLDHFLSQCPYIFIGFEKLTKLLKIACTFKKIDLVKRLTEMILINNPNEDFSGQLEIAISVKSIEIFNYFIDKKVFIDKNHIIEFGSMNVEFYLLIKKSFPEIQIQSIDNLLSNAIKCQNKELVEYLLKNGSPIKNNLFLAVSYGYLDMVDIILKYNNKPSIVNTDLKERTILHYAIKNSDVQMVKRILKIPGINPLLCNNKKKSALSLAILSKNIEIIEEILDFLGERISEKRIIDEISKSTIDLISEEKKCLKKDESADKNTILVLKRVLRIKGIDPNICGPKYTFLLYSCEVGEKKIVKMLLKMDNIDVNACSNVDGNTPLITSIIYNNIDIALLLIKDKRTNVNLNNFDDQTALTMAVQKNLPEVINFLIKNEKFDPEESHLNFAFYKSFGEIATQLSSLKSLDVNYYYNHQTTLIDAVNNLYYEKIDLIINNPSFDKDKSQFKKAIFIIIQQSNEKEFKKMLNALKFDINLSIDSRSILSIAVEYKSLEIIKCILQNPNFDSAKSDILSAFLKGLSYYHIIILSDNEYYEYYDDDDIGSTEQPSSNDILNELSEFDKKHDNLIDMKKLLPNGKSFFTYRQKLTNACDFVKYLIDHGADPNEPDKDGVYPLEYAISTGNKDFVFELIRSGKIDLNIKTIMKPKKPDFQPTEKNETFLHLAAKIDDTIIFRLFLNETILDINAVDDSGETPLIKACKYGNADNIELLFENKNLDYLHRNNEGKDALDILNSFYINKKNESPIKDKNTYMKQLLHLIKLNKKAAKSSIYEYEYE